MPLHRSSVALVAVLALFAGRASAGDAVAGTDPADPAQLDVFIAAKMDEAGIAGMGAAILVDRRIAWAKGYGYADLASRRPFTPDTVINIGSISKTVTGAAMMRAVQDGKLALDADVDAYLPFEVDNPHQPGRQITLRQLATHTSGITDRWEVYRELYRYGGDRGEPLGAFLRGYFVPGGAHYDPANFLDAAPGTQRDYSNIGAALAGYAVETATGRALADYAREKLFEPLGMRHTYWSLAEVAPGAHATLYVAQNGMTIPIPQYELTTYPDGGVRSSVADLARLFAALLNAGEYEGTRILEPAVAREMLRLEFTDARKPANVDPKEKNSGIFWQTKFNGTKMGHGGNDPGVATEMEASLSGDVGVVLFSNTSLSGAEGKAYVEILQALFRRAEAMKAGD